MSAMKDLGFFILRGRSKRMLREAMRTIQPLRRTAPDAYVGMRELIRSEFDAGKDVTDPVRIRYLHLEGDKQLNKLRGYILGAMGR